MVFPPVSDREVADTVLSLSSVIPSVFRLLEFTGSSNVRAIVPKFMSTENWSKFGLTVSCIKPEAFKLAGNASFGSSAKSCTPPVSMVR